MGNIKKWIQLCFFLLSAGMMLALYFGYGNGDDGDLRIGRDHDTIIAELTGNIENVIDRVTLQIDDDGQVTQHVLDRNERMWTFAGELNKTYLVDAQIEYASGNTQDIHKELYLYDAEALPDLPVVRITTLSGEEPTCNFLAAPENARGMTTIDHSLEKAVVVLDFPDRPSVTLRSEIRIRGNTSSTSKEKVSYKLNLKDKEDLLGRGKSHANKEWVLLNCGGNLNLYVGNLLSNLIELDYSPACTLVNVILNDDWKGIYYLSETVSRAENRVNIGYDGSIFENDLYWWSEELYHRAPGQDYAVAFTVKYPDITNAQDMRFQTLTQLIDDFTGRIEGRDESVWEMLDIDSFVNWIIVQDILRQGDVTGSNMYYSIKHLRQAVGTDNKITIGPMWDFDAVLGASRTWMPDVPGWSRPHLDTSRYYAQLFDTAVFRQAYKTRWQSVTSSICESLTSDLLSLLEQHGEAIEKSRKMNDLRWGTWSQPVQDEVDYDIAFLRQQKEWIDEAVELWN
ncbi:MAG: CotH kinase family protein [Clostridia bacterium]|nr:CotH kinase family protein [Clostridia bacterium]